MHFNKDEVNNLPIEDIRKLLEFFFKKNKIVNAINFLKSLDKTRLISLKSVILRYIIKIPIEDKETFCSLITCTVSIYDAYELKSLLKDFYKDDNIDKYNEFEKNNLANLAIARTNIEGSMNEYFIELLSKYDEPEEQLVNYLKICLEKQPVVGEKEKKLVSTVSKSVLLCDNINIIVEFIRCFYDIISPEDLNDIVDSVICENNHHKMLYLSTVLTKREDLILKIGYLICDSNDAEYIYLFALQHRGILYDDEREHFKISMSQTKDSFWITYYAISIDNTILDYYSISKDVLKENVNYDALNIEDKKKIDKMILEYKLN